MTYRPVDFLNESFLLTVTEKGRVAKSADLEEEDLFAYEEAWVRYEPHRKIIYVKAKTLRQSMKELPHVGYENVFTSGQYLGSMMMAFYRSTPFRADNCEVFAFDLNRSEDTGVTIPDFRRQQQYKIYEKKYGRGSQQVLEAMKKWERRYVDKVKRDGNVQVTTGEQSEFASTINKLQEQIRILRYRAQGKKPVKRKPKPTQTLPELDAFIKDNNQHIRRKLTRRVIVDGVPTLQTKTYDPHEHGLETIGLYTDITDITGKRSSALALQVAALKLTVPNFKEDVRRTKAQTVRIHSQKHQGCVYCAVFDMRKSDADAP